MENLNFSTREIKFQRLAGMMSDLINEYIEHPALSVSKPTPQILQQILKARRARSDHFPSDLFADPAWDMLLDLYHASLAGQFVTISALGIAANVPATTALRYIQILEQKKLLVRHPDPLDGRRFFVSLTKASQESFECYFAKHPVQGAI